MELKTTITNDDEHLVDENDANETWMSSLPEISMLDVSPQSSAVGLTFGPHSGKQLQSALSSFASDNQAADVNENDYVPPSKQPTDDLMSY